MSPVGDVMFIVSEIRKPSDVSIFSLHSSREATPFVCSMTVTDDCEVIEVKSGQSPSSTKHSVTRFY